MDEYYDLAEEIIENPTMMNEILDKRSNEEIERLYFTLKQMHEDIIGDISEVFKEEDKEKDEQIKHMMDLIYDELERNEQEEIEDGSVEETTVEESVYSNTENENKEALLEELSNLEYYLYELGKTMDEKDLGEQYDSFEIEDMWRERHSYEDRIEEIESKIYMIEMGELGTSLTSMNPDEIKQQYEGLLEKRKSYTQMAEDGYEVDELEWKINSGLIEMIEEYIKANPELSEFEQPSNDEIEALLAKEMKSKSFRDAGFEVNEFGEIIRPAKQQTVDELKNMSEEELQGLIEKNNKTIEHNNKTLKKSLVERILEQQKTISKQQEEILNLSSQKKEF